MPPHAKATELRLTALPVAKAADAIRRSGSRHVSVATIQADLAAGAPSNPDGTLNLIEYAAWLARENASGR